MKMSVVVPVYGCPEALQPLYERLTDVLNRITKDYEIILVNDGCPKGSWNGVTNICKQDKHVVGINLSRNFGQVNATNAGLEYASGEYVVLMDCDLQDRPEAVLDLYEEIEKGYDIVFGARKERKDNWFVKFCSKTFYSIYNSMVDGNFNPDIANLCMVRKKVLDEYNDLPEHNKSYTTILSWMGYRTSILEIEAEERLEGKSSYNFSKRLALAIDMLTFQSNKPLYFFIKLGISIGVLAFIYICYQLGIYFLVGGAPSGWMSLIAVISLLGGIQLVSIGVIGIYIGNIFNETKNRKSYFIQEILNGRENKETGSNRSK